MHCLQSRGLYLKTFAREAKRLQVGYFSCRCTAVEIQGPQYSKRDHTQIQLNVLTVTIHVESEFTFRPGMKNYSFKSHLGLEGMDEDFSPLHSDQLPKASITGGTCSHLALRRLNFHSNTPCSQPGKHSSALIEAFASFTLQQSSSSTAHQTRGQRRVFQQQSHQPGLRSDREAPLCSAIVLSPFASVPLQAASVQQQT